MVEEIFKSFRDNIKERTTNPFLGTFVIVWCIHNWKLLYGLFNFEVYFTLENKIEYVENHFSQISFLCNLFTVIWHTIIVLIVTYILLSFSRFITNVFEKKVTPWVYKVTDKNSIVLKGEYERVLAKNVQLGKKVKEERDGRLEVEEERDKALKENLELRSVKSNESAAKNSNLDTVEEDINTHYEDAINYKHWDHTNWEGRLEEIKIFRSGNTITVSNPNFIHRREGAVNSHQSRNLEYIYANTGHEWNVICVPKWDGKESIVFDFEHRKSDSTNSFTERNIKFIDWDGIGKEASIPPIKIVEGQTVYNIGFHIERIE